MFDLYSLINKIYYFSMKKSFVDSNKTVSPFRSPDQDVHNRSYEFNKARYTEVTI